MIQNKKHRIINNKILRKELAKLVEYEIQKAN